MFTFSKPHPQQQLLWFLRHQWDKVLFSPMSTV